MCNQRARAFAQDLRRRVRAALASRVLVGSRMTKQPTNGATFYVALYIIEATTMLCGLIMVMVIALMR